MTGKQNTVGIITDRLGSMNCSKCNERLDISEFELFDKFACPECGTEQTVPAQLGNFHLIDVMGTGGMGAVYLAIDKSLNRNVALKVMHKAYGKDSKFYKDFQREAQATARLNHVNVVQVYSLGEEKEQPYIVMELVEGGRLDTEAESKTGRDLEELVLNTAIGVGQGLQAAADAGIIHGDIKPANILFDNYGQPKVVDFGLARFAGSTEGAGEIWGTPYYIAPEKARSKKEDARSDQYSLGATLWHVLAGRPPFEGDTPTDVVIARLKAPAPDIRDVNPDVSEKTASLLKRMMADEPNRRYPNYHSMAADARKVLSELPAAPSSGKGRRLMPTTTIQKRDAAAISAATSSGAPAAKKGPPIGAILGGVILVAAIVAGGIILMKPPKEKPKGTMLNDFQREQQRKRAEALKRTQAKSQNKATGSSSGNVSNSSSTDAKPFSDEQIQNLNLSVSSFLTGAFDSVSKLNGVIKNSPKDKTAYQWANLHNALYLLLNDDSGEAKKMAKKMAGLRINYNDDALKEKPELFCNFIAGSITEEQLDQGLTGTAEWYAAYGKFIKSLMRAAKGNMEEVEELSAVYKKGDPEDWRQVWAVLAESFNKQAKEMNSFLSDGELSGSEINDINTDFYLLWRNVTAKAPKAAAAVVKKAAPVVKKPRKGSKADVAAKKLASEAANAEMATVKKLGAEQVENIKKKEFKTALTNLEALAAELKTDGGKQTYSQYVEAHKMLNELHSLVIQGMKNSPYKGSISIGKPRYYKDETKVGIIARSGKKGLVSWYKINPADYTMLANYYLANSELPQTQIARSTFGLAYYIKVSGKAKEAENYATKAKVLDEKLTPLIKTFITEGK